METNPSFHPAMKTRMQFLETLYRENREARHLPLDRTEFARTGARLGFEAAYFARRKFLSAAALLYLTGGGETYLYEAGETMDAIAAEPTWVHPAHGDEVDLFSAETAFLLAELCTVLPLENGRRERVLSAVKKNGIEPFRRSTFRWEREGGNWLAVCMGNVAGALFYADGVEFRRQRARLEGGLSRYLDEFPADGYCQEGLEYWNFGFGAFVRSAELCFPHLLDLPKARAVARYPQACFLAGNVTASFSDCPMDGRANRGLVNFLARRYGTPLLTEEETEIRAENCAWLPLSRGLRDGFFVAPFRERQGGIFCGGKLYISHRAAYSFAVKAGDNGEPHNHNDVGSFLLSDGDGQFVCDIGQPLYDRDYFSERRYLSLAASSLGHSVPIVNGQGQLAGKEHGGILRGGLSVEFAGAYPNCKKLVRTFSLGEEGISVRDEFAAEDAVTERFVCSRDPSGGIVSDEGIVPRVHAETYFGHDGKEKCVYLADFDVPRGRTSAAFHIRAKGEQ